MKKVFSIGGKLIKENGEVFIIAEAGVNHNGNLKMALNLIRVASEAGADAVKFQTFKAEQVVINKGEMAAYQKRNMRIKKTQREMLRMLELDESFYPDLLKECRKRNIIFLSTPHGGKKSVDFLESFDVKAYKVGSGDLTNFILLEKLAKLKKPIIIGTGMGTLKEVKNAIKYIKENGNNKIVMLHCTTNYPCPFDEVNLLAMRTMMKELDVPVGYSDHTLGSQVAIMAATLGAAVYECHFTLNKSLPGPDHPASAEPEELKEKIKAIRDVRLILGKAKKWPNPSESSNMIITVRKSIVFNRPLEKGEIVTRENIESKRPGNGLCPIYFEKVLGKKLKRSVLEDEQVLLKDLK